MKRILVLNDDEGILILYADELAEEGYDVVTANESTGLMELIERKRPDLMVMEMRFGGEETLLLLRNIRFIYPELITVLCIPLCHSLFDLDLTRAAHHVIKRPCLRELKQKIRTAFEGSGGTVAETRPEREEERGGPCQYMIYA